MAAPARETPVITVPSSSGDVVERAAAPGKDEPMILPGTGGGVPGKGGEAMVCVQATRASQTPPLIVPDIHRVLEGTGKLFCVAVVLEKANHHCLLGLRGRDCSHV